MTTKRMSALNLTSVILVAFLLNLVLDGPAVLSVALFAVLLAAVLFLVRTDGGGKDE